MLKKNRVKISLPFYANKKGRILDLAFPIKKIKKFKAKTPERNIQESGVDKDNIKKSLPLTVMGGLLSVRFTCRK